MRIGINIPDDLFERMAPLKSVTNISEVCRKAIETHVEAYEQAKKRAEEDGMDALAERLSRRLDEPDIDWEGLALQDARMWAEMATEQWEVLEDRLEARGRQGHLPYDVPVPRVQGCKGFGDRWDENDELTLRQFERDLKTDHFQAAKTRYDRAFVSYLIAVWQKAKEQSERRSTSRAVARKRAHQESRTRVELPQCLTDLEGQTQT